MNPDASSTRTSCNRTNLSVRQNKVAFLSENVQEAGVRGRGQVRSVRDKDRNEDGDVADEVAEVADLEAHDQFEQAGVGDGYTERD